MDDVFLDSSIFVSHCMVGDRALIKLLKFKLYTSPNVIEESFYKSLYLKTEDLYGKRSKYLLKDKYLKNRESYREIYRYFNEFVRKLVDSGHLKILPVNEEIFLSSLDISWRYGLLPNDALIAATCKYYGIKTIATFDDDFKRVDFLQVLDLDKI